MGFLSRPAAVRYSSIEHLYTERDQVSWYWRFGAFAASWFILGGFLTLPSQFDSSPDLSVSQTRLAVFSVAILTAGCTLTAVLWFLVKNPIFRSDFVFLPAFSSSALGLLTLTYCFLTSRRYGWNTASLLTLIASIITTLGYGGLLWWTQRQTVMIRNNLPVKKPRRSHHRSRSPRQVMSEIHQQQQHQYHYQGPPSYREQSVDLSLHADSDTKSLESGATEMDNDAKVAYTGHFAPPGPPPLNAAAAPPLSAPTPVQHRARDPASGQLQSVPSFAQSTTTQGTDLLDGQQYSNRGTRSYPASRAVSAYPASAYPG